MDFLVTVLIILCVLAVALLVGIPFMLWKGRQRPEMKRQWTDPKMHGNRKE